MGAVCKARHTRLDRTVAIKISRAESGERFEREARSVAALNDPHIWPLYDIGPDYLVMEFITGAALKGWLPEAKAVEYAARRFGEFRPAAVRPCSSRKRSATAPGAFLVTLRCPAGRPARSGCAPRSSRTPESVGASEKLLDYGSDSYGAPFRDGLEARG